MERYEIEKRQIVTNHAFAQNVKWLIHVCTRGDRDHDTFFGSMSMTLILIFSSLFFLIYASCNFFPRLALMSFSAQYTTVNSNLIKLVLQKKHKLCVYHDHTYGINVKLSFEPFKFWYSLPHNFCWWFCIRMFSVLKHQR